MAQYSDAMIDTAYIAISVQTGHSRAVKHSYMLSSESAQSGTESTSAFVMQVFFEGVALMLVLSSMRPASLFVVYFENLGG